MIKKHSFAGNIMITYMTQAISLCVSFVINLILPKFISVYQYACWQNYCLYAGYVGVLHFGLLDGLVLRYSQFDYDKLDKPRIRSQFIILFISICSFAVVLSFVALCGLTGVSRTVAFLVAISIVTKNVFTYNSYMLQITNRINKYSLLVISLRLGNGFLVCLFLATGMKNFAWYCLADLAGDLVGITVAGFFNKGLLFGSCIPVKDAWIEYKKNISAGIALMVANWSAMLLNAGAKTIVQWHWDPLTFGKVSFSFSLSNMFVSFINATSIVLFPQLKRLPEERLPDLYRNIREFVSIVLYTVLLAYFPVCWILEKYLPAYTQSFGYLAILLPSIIFTSKINLLTNTYLKAYRKEREMLKVNVISLLVAISSFAVSAYIFDSLNATLICVVLSNMLRSVLSEIAVMHEIKISFRKDIFVEAALTLAFIICANFFKRWSAFGVYAVVLSIYIFGHRRVFESLLKRISSKVVR